MASMRMQPKAVFWLLGRKGTFQFRYRSGTYDENLLERVINKLVEEAIAAAFACDQVQYHVDFISQSAHQDVREHLSRKKVPYIPVSSPPVLSPVEDNNTSGSVPFTFCEEKRRITREHRQECVVIFEDIFGDVPVMEADLVIINFFALEGWSLAELFNVRCVIAAP
ncbi:UDP-glucuronosyl/UDP-glucosyltransferase [Artemisia annua]|uniref:UDP-glucuronosyl/UDP-glucosyltransferase n=1 Tax=Artemisia annua TaxID=35608 RepID=A0A2U1NBJ9_ARTAN|nr:UDP-glucuronosyl/UDP-glucosyltransferase [Artemisia annua]